MTTNIILRPPVPADAEPCGRILYSAFYGIATAHNFPPDMPSPEFGEGLAHMLIETPGFFGVVAEQDGRVVGSNFMSEQDAVRGVGPITVDPSVQGAGVGRRLMQAVIDRGKDAASVRLVQDAFNTRSMSLYASLGFDAKEPLALLQGRAANKGKFEGRPLQPSDAAACNELCRRVHGFDRAAEVAHGAPGAKPWVATKDGRVVAYATNPTFWIVGHGVAESDEAMIALLSSFSAANAEPLSFLFPIRQAELFRWCLAAGLRVVKPMTLMSTGQYNEPKGSWFPSVAY